MFAFRINGAKIDIFLYICPTKMSNFYDFFGYAPVVQRIERRFPKP